MRSQLDRELVESLNESSNQEFIENINQKIYDLFGAAITDISLKSPFVKVDKCVLIPVNEIYTGAVSQMSKYTYFLGIENPQIEFNSKMKKNFWKYIWSEFKASWRLGRKKYKKRKKEKKEDVSSFQLDKYKLSDFRHDVVVNLANYLQESSLIYEKKRYISLVGIDDFGTNVVIDVYICVYESKSNVYKLYKENRNKFYSVNFGNRYENIEQKKNSCGEMFFNMLKIFNAIFSKNNNRIPNQILLESLIYNCPDVLFDKDDVYKTFINVSNYIRLANPKAFLSICDGNKTIFEDPLIVDVNAQIDYGKIINMLDVFKY